MLKTNTFKEIIPLQTLNSDHAPIVLQFNIINNKLTYKDKPLSFHKLNITNIPENKINQFRSDLKHLANKHFIPLLSKVNKKEFNEDNMHKLETITEYITKSIYNKAKHYFGICKNINKNNKYDKGWISKEWINNYKQSKAIAKAITIIHKLKLEKFNTYTLNSNLEYINGVNEEILKDKSNRLLEFPIIKMFITSNEKSTIKGDIKNILIIERNNNYQVKIPTEKRNIL